jgi:hypothetical protein
MIYLAMMVAIAFGAGIAYQGIQYPDIFQIRHVYALYASVAEITIFAFAAKALGDDFQYKTTTQLFDNAYPRYQVLLSKLFSLVMLGLCLGLVSTIISTIAKPFMGVEQTVAEMFTDAYTVWLIYFAVSFCVGSFILLVSIFTQNTVASFIGCVAGFWIAPRVIQMVLFKWGENELVSLIVGSIPFYTASQKLTQSTIAPNELIGLLLGGLIFTLIATYVLRHKDLK